MSLSKKLRFEVFKRDSFTCQYCGRSAPDVILQVDHIEPRSKGGKNNILNLITSCAECNAGKSDRRLSDRAVVGKQKAQLDQLQERREQIAMMLQWQQELLNTEADTVIQLANMFDDMTPGWSTNERGRQSLLKWVRQFGPQAVLEAMKQSAAQYVEFEDDRVTRASRSKAFDYIPRICAVAKRMQTKPYLRDLYYIRGILKKRFKDVDQVRAIRLMENAVDAGLPIFELREHATDSMSWWHFQDALYRFIDEATLHN